MSKQPQASTSSRGAGGSSRHQHGGMSATQTGGSAVVLCELAVDPAATSDVVVPRSCVPASSAPSSDDMIVLSIKPLEQSAANVLTGERKTKQRRRAQPILHAVKREQPDASPADSAAKDMPSSLEAGAGKREQRDRQDQRQDKVIWLSSNAAASFDWIPKGNAGARRQPIAVSIVPSPPPGELRAQLVEIHFNGVYLGRGDMLRLSLALTTRRVISTNEKVSLHGTTARLRVGGIYNAHGRRLASACVDERTRVAFRTQSARVFVFVELSQEMWHFEEDGSMYAEKCDVFLADLFRHWAGNPADGARASLATNHSISIVLYGRVIYDEADSKNAGDEKAPPLIRDEHGQLYRDFYKVILDLTQSPPPTVVAAVAQEIRAWSARVLEFSPRVPLSSKRLAFAHESNLLEAVNLALNSFEEHWIDRDLQVTGLALLAITAGTSYYSVPKDLLRLTTERMLSHGVGLDIISLSKTPLHTVPLFSFLGQDPTLAEQMFESPSSSSLSKAVTAASQYQGDNGGSKNSSSIRPDGPRNVAIPADQRDPLYFDPPNPRNLTRTLYYTEPLFVFCSFWGSQIDKPHRVDRFMPRARCYELFFQGIGEEMAIALPMLDLGATASLNQRAAHRPPWSQLSAEAQHQRLLQQEAYDLAAVGGPRARGAGALDALHGSYISAQSGGARSSLVGSPDSKTSNDELVISTAISPRKLMAPPSVVRSRKEAMASTSQVPTPTAEEPDKDLRGRSMALPRPLTRGQSRSKTPVAPKKRDASIAASVRTASSSLSRADGRTRGSSVSTSATPALISRLVSSPHQSPGAASPAPTTQPARTGWLGLFRSNSQSSTSQAPPSVKVQRIDAQAHVSPQMQWDPASAAPAAPTVSSVNASAAGASARRQSVVPSTDVSGDSTNSSSIKRSKPISIGNKSNPLGMEPPSKDVAGSRGQASSYHTHLSHSNEFLGSRRSIDPKFNPSKPEKLSVGLADQARRWASIFPRHANDQRAVNWTSICTPACLPLTTDYLPADEELEKLYSEYKYSIPTTSASSSFTLRADLPSGSAALEILLELVSQRIAQGFQISTAKEKQGRGTSSDTTALGVLRQPDLLEAAPLYLSLANQTHRITYDRTTRSIVVQVYRRRRSWTKRDVDYRAMIWTIGSGRWDTTSTTFPWPSMLDPSDWQAIDRLCAGLERMEANPTTRYWRTRLVLIPSDESPELESLTKSQLLAGQGEAGEPPKTPEEVYLRGFLALMNSLQAVRYLPAGTDREKEPMPTEITNLSPAEWALQVALDNMQLPREKAASPRAAGWLRRVTSTSTRTSRERESEASLQKQLHKSEEAQGSASAPEAADGESKRPVIAMSHSLILDLDPQRRSARAQRILAHVDRSHNPLAAYHIELAWLSGSGKIIDNAIKGWVKLVAAYGLSLVEVSTRPVLARPNPFVSPRIVPLAVPPPPLHHPSPHYAEAELLQKLCGFVLDIGADSGPDNTFPEDIEVAYSYRRFSTNTSQFIHRSGACLVAILGGKAGFACMPNRFHSYYAAKKVPPEAVFNQLEAVCRDVQKLRDFWDSLVSASEDA